MRFCTACGAAMEAAPAQALAACALCGAPAKPGMRFCVNCGASMEPPGAVPDQRGAAPPPLPQGDGAALPYPSQAPPAYSAPELPPMPPQPGPAAASPAFPPAAPPPAPARMEAPPAAPPPLPPEAPYYAGYPPVAPGQPAPQSRSGPGVGMILGVVALLLVLAGGGYFGYRKFFAKPVPPETAAKQGQTETASAAAGRASAPAQAVPVPVAELPAQQRQPAAVAPPLSVPPSQTAPPVSRSPQAPSPAQVKPSAPAAATGRPTAAPPAPASSSAAPPSFPAATERPPVSATPAGAVPRPSPASQPPAAARPGILRPEREISTPQSQPPPRTPAPPAGPSSGVLVWSGELRKGEIVTIEGQHASSGSLQGALPGVPVILETDYKGIGFAETPGPSNGWKRVSFRALRNQKVVVTLRWKTFD